MLTPLMYILSCYDESYNLGKPVAMSGVSKSDLDAIYGVALDMCRNVTDVETMFMDTSITGEHYFCGACLLGDDVIEISRPACFIVNRVIACAPIVVEHIKQLKQEDSIDLTSNDIVMRMEGTPEYAYYYVFEVMSANEPYANRIEKIKNVYDSILASQALSAEGLPDERGKFVTQSKMSYWAKMICIDSIKYDGCLPEKPFTAEDFRNLNAELSKIGLPGFTNPSATYLAYGSDRPGRKISANLPVEIVSYLRECLRSGGVEV